MHETMRVSSKDLVLAIPLSQMQRAANMLKPEAVNFNRLSVENNLEEHNATTIVDTLETIKKGVSNYVSWKANALLNVEKEDDARAELKNLINIATAMEQAPKFVTGVDPRKLLKIETITTRIIPEIGALWFTFLSCDYERDLTLKVYAKLLARVTSNLVDVLRAATRAFEMDISAPITTFSILGCKIDTSYIASDTLKFTLHDEVVAFSPEEIEEQRRREREAAEEKRRQEELEEAKRLVKSHAEDVLNAYNKHRELGNLKKFSFTDSAVRALTDPHDMNDLDNCKAIYRLLMAMSNSVRYMPGENGPIQDRIMGSFMELENDILTYGQQFTLYLHEYNLTHNDIVRALSLFSSDNGKIMAQYVDSKEFIEEFMDNPKSPKIIHMFVMK